MATYYACPLKDGFLYKATPVNAKDINDLRKKLCKDGKTKEIFVYTKPDTNNSSLSGVLTVYRDGKITWNVRGNSASIMDVDPKTGKAIRNKLEELFTFSVTSLDHNDYKQYGQFTETLPNYSSARKYAIKKVLSKDDTKQVLIVIAYKRGSGGHLYKHLNMYIWSDHGKKYYVDPKTGNLMRD